MKVLSIFAFGLAVAESLLSDTDSLLSDGELSLLQTEQLLSDNDILLSATESLLADSELALAATEMNYSEEESLLDDPESLFISTDYVLGDLDELESAEGFAESQAVVESDVDEAVTESIRAELTMIPQGEFATARAPIAPALVQNPAPAAGSCKIYTLKPGDSCWLISRVNMITIEQLSAWNPTMSCSHLLVDQQVCVSQPNTNDASPGPSSSQPSGAPDGGNSGGSCREYVVKSGDSCWFIGTNAGITLEQVQAYNPGLNCQGLQIGQHLCLSPGTLSSAAGGSSTSVPTIPAEMTPSPGSCKLYSVVSGDSCYEISIRTQVYLGDLLSYNPNLDCNRLYPGQILCLSPGKPIVNKPAADDKGICAWHRVRSGETCSSIGQSYGVRAEEIEALNQNTWRWSGCKNLQVNSKICLSLGTSPLPDVNPQVECGLESKGNRTCAFNLCCSKWGYCGFDEGFCAVSNGAPGTGCQSNCNYRPSF